MNISTCTFSLFFQPVPTIRRAAFDIEARLDSYMKPFQIYPIPDEAPFELPRISAGTEFGHSSLSIAAQSAQVQSHFDENYSSDFAKSLTYSHAKAMELYRALSTMESIRIQFAGLSAQLLAAASEIGKSPVSFISDTYLKVKSNLPMSDASARLVYFLGDDLYLNIEVQRLLPVGPVSINVVPDGVTVLKKVAQSEEMLAVSIDFNNRLAYNTGRPLGCSEAIINEFYGRVRIFVENGIDAFLTSGEVRF